MTVGEKVQLRGRQSPAFHMFNNLNLCVNPPADRVNALQPRRLQEILRGSDSAGPGEHVTPSVGWFSVNYAAAASVDPL